jgi:RNA polymerase sigma-70 factor (ECF subfamily)
MDIATTAGKHCTPDRESSRTDPEVTLKEKLILSYEYLIAPIESQMMRSIWRIVRHPEAAEDTMQDALTTIWKKLDRIHRHPNPQAFILKICMNAAYDTLRKSMRIRQREGGAEIQNLPAESSHNGLEQLEKKNVEAEILEAIGRLPKKQALAVMMRIVQDQSYDSIAQVLNCSEVTARIHVSKGRAKLNRWLSHLNPKAPKERENESQK